MLRQVFRHGRDYKLIVWQLGRDEEQHLSTKPPVEDVSTSRPEPKRLHLLEVNTMNFCSFAACPSVSAGEGNDDSLSIDEAEEILIAVPHTLASDAVRSQYPFSWDEIEH